MQTVAHILRCKENQAIARIAPTATVIDALALLAEQRDSASF